MANQYAIDAAHHVVRLSGPIPAALGDWCATLDAVLADPTFSPGYSFLSDRRGTTVAPSDAYMLDGVEYLQAHRSQFQGCRWAIVTDSAALDGWARVVTLLVERAGIRCRVFRSMDEAWQWMTAS